MKLEGLNFFMETPNGDIAGIRETQEISIISDQVVDSDFDFGQEISGTVEYEEPKSMKELLELGFTRKQAWDIHLRKGESWKQS
ncbi:PadR family transcriptional regulator [Bacillus mycoides]|uniref:PadR family transcriptional regulator n=1 Tax=Bacillus mycoides TaxID=1405 RepID=UPI002E23464B|nr:PadR family transcriptional regulator [Bacillus mycoides]